MKKLAIAVLLFAMAAYDAAADGGMWMVNLIDGNLASKMKAAGMKTETSMIYDEASASFSDAVVYFDEGTGCVISGNGLVLTTHHCAYSDITSVSPEGRNYLEEGFWAMSMEDEIPIPGKKVRFLKYIIDVTDDVLEYKAEIESEGKYFNSRRMKFLMEKAVRDETGYDAELSEMWSGERYYMSLYEVYGDVRLVAAPPVSLASFGGETDNWVWPQHKGDFALYRIYVAADGTPAGYSPENVPLTPDYFFTISCDGYSEGDFTLIMGFPSGTDRYSSSFAVKDNMYRANPVSIGSMKERMRIIGSRMQCDSTVRLKYFNTFFTLGNSEKYDSGESRNILKYHILDSIAARERSLQEWVDADQSRRERWGGLLDELRQKYADVYEISENALYFRESIIKGTGLYPYVRGMEIRRSRHGDSPRTVRHIRESLAAVGDIWSHLDRGVEKSLLEYSVAQFYTHVASDYHSPFHAYLKELFGTDYKAMADYVWNNSFFTDEAHYDSLMARVSPIFADSTSYGIDGCDAACEALRKEVSLYDDPLYQLFRSYRMSGFYTVMGEIEDGVSVRMLEDEYVRMLYSMWNEQGVPQYPDANSTMRFSYGSVSSFTPSDAVFYSWKSTVDGILQKYSSGAADYDAPEDFIQLLRSEDWGRWAAEDGRMYVDFITDNDVAKGNSGSPVLDSQGRLIGMAFDANKESLAGSLYYLEDYNKTVCADIRYILWILDRYAGLDRVLDELGF